MLTVTVRSKINCVYIFQLVQEQIQSVSDYTIH